MTAPNKRLSVIMATVAVLLTIPLVAMQFSEEVIWTFSDFLIAGILLAGTGLLIEFIIRKVCNRERRIVLGICVLLSLLLIWAELAVGIFGTPFAGS